MQSTSIEDLRREASALGRLVLRREIESEFVDRYVAAHTHLFTEALPSREAALVAFAMRHPMLLPSLDAAAALVRPGSLLHRKGLLMAAILEASPRYADEFLPRRAGVPQLVVLCVQTGITTLVRLAIGIPLLGLVGRSS